MSMGFEQPVDRKAVLPHISDYRIRRRRIGATGRSVEVQDTVNDRRLSRGGVPDDVGRGVGRLVEERVNDRRYRRLRTFNLRNCLIQRRFHDRLQLLISWFM
jgi:hypothetical protein